jgi:FkbM family methyltransferase
MHIPRVRLNLIELVLLGALVAVLAYVAGRHRTEVRLMPYLSRSASELQVLADRYGPARNSEYGEEWIVRDYFNDMRGGVFVDVGANDHQRNSNTYFLERELGWSGLAIEPQEQFAEAYARYRPRTTFVPLFVSDVSNNRAVLYVPGNNNLIASSTREFVEGKGGDDIVPHETNTTTLDDILRRSGIERFDFLSMDIELHEPAALRGFSIETFAPRLVGIEAHPQVRQEILDYFAAHDYVVIGKYLRADTENLWFEPSGLRAGQSRTGNLKVVSVP